MNLDRICGPGAVQLQLDCSSPASEEANSVVQDPDERTDIYQGRALLCHELANVWRGKF